MKTIKQIREEYESRFLKQIATNASEMTMLDEDKKESAKMPSSKDMPIMIIFRRVQYRMFPDKQTVALYYSKTLNKFLSIPFGPKGNVNLSESDISIIDEDWQKVNRQDKTAGLSQAAVNAYRREHPGSKLKTAVTEKNPTGKRAARRKSFCARMGGMKSRLTSAKTARDPDSNINKALRRWNCEESFKQKLQEKRQERLDEFAFLAPALAAAGEMATGAAVRGLAAAGARGLASHVAKRGITRTAQALAGKAARSAAGKALKGVGRLAGTVGKYALKKALAPDQQAKQSQQTQDSGIQRERPQPKVRSYTASELAKNRAGDVSGSLESQASRRYSKSILAPSSSQQQENKISDIRKMIDENIKIMELSINGRTVKLNNNMAKRILEVYDNVNTKNKKIVEGMLNEDLESFKKLINFTIKV